MIEPLFDSPKIVWEPLGQQRCSFRIPDETAKHMMLCHPVSRELHHLKAYFSA